MATTMLPQLVVLNVPKAAINTYIYRKDDTSVVAGEDSIFSPLARIELEQAKVNSKYVHLRFSYSNKYWQKNTDDDSIVAVSNKPEEDKEKPSCTLFEPTLQSDELYLTHVQTGWRVMMNNSTSALYVDKNSIGAPLGFVDGETLVKLPEYVAFKGNNGRYLKEYHIESHYFLQFGSDDPNVTLSVHKVSLMRDGHVRIQFDHTGWFWRNGYDWIFADSDDFTSNDKATLFWPIKLDDNTIALRNAGNNNFCKRLSLDGKISCLNAGVSTITDETRMQVQELVTKRKIYNVQYRMEDARIFGETPFIGGTATVTNPSDQEASMAVSITYEDQKSYTFSRGISLTAGVSITMEGGIPFIMDEKIEISLQISGSFEWDTTKTTTISVMASDTVPVPANSTVTVGYVGTRGTCNVPFNYTREDRSSTSGEITRTDEIDGIYQGVNCYNFKFQVIK